MSSIFPSHIFGNTLRDAFRLVVGPSAQFINADPKVWVDVRYFNAKGDGTTDDTVAIQAAINAVASGGTVLFPVGTYPISSSLTIANDNVQLVGAGWGSVIQAKSTFIPTTPMVWVQGPGGALNFRRGLKVSDLFLNGNNVTGAIGLELDSTYNARIDHVWVRYCIGTGIYLNGIAGAFGAYTNISDSIISDGGAGTGVLTNNHEFSTIKSSVIAWHNTAGGVGIKLQNSSNQIVSTTFDECDTALWVEFAIGNSVTNSYFDRGITRFVNLHGARTTRLIGNEFGLFSGSGSKNMIDVSSASNAGNQVGLNTVNENGTGWSSFVTEAAGTGGTVPNQYIGNETRGLSVSRQTGIFRHNRGYNPVGSVSAPAFPNTTVTITNTAGVDVTAFIANGTGAITQQAIGGTNTNYQIAANGWGMVRIPAGQTYTPTYGSGTPTWTWFGD